jgi:glycerol-3-phosphate O-acyltransferase
VIRYNLPLHHNVLSVSDQDFVEMKLVRAAHVDKPLPRNDVMLNAASHLILASYRNQLSHVFVRIAMVALSINGCTSQETLSLSTLKTDLLSYRILHRTVYVERFNVI